MRILEVNKFYYPRRGTERHFLDLVNVLRHAGHKVAVFAMDDSRNVARGESDQFVSTVGYNTGDSTVWQKLIGISRLFWSFEARRVMRQLLSDFHPDVVHIHNAYHQLSFSFLSLIKKQHIPILLTVHDYHLISPDKDVYYPEVGKSYWKFLLVNKYGLGKRVLLALKSYWERLCGFREMVDRFIAPSEYVKRILVTGGIASEKIVVIPHFVMESEVTASVALPQQPYAIYFGGVTPEKNISELVELFIHLKQRLVLAGAKHTSLPESEFVTYVGELPKDTLDAYIQGSSCVVSASRLPETFGLIVLEANINGKPFFGYRTGAFPELVENGRNGYLAANREEFTKNLEGFFAGSLALEDEGVIARVTRDQYTADAYLAKFMAVIDGVKNAAA